MLLLDGGSSPGHARTLRVTCFGNFRIAGRSGWERGPEPRRAREVMQYLILHPRSVAPRERLTDVLWPGESPDVVVHRLHSAISGARTFLRRLLGGFNAIRCTDEGYAWDPELRLDSDVVAFDDLYRDGSAAAAREAVSLYAGELLQGQDAEWVRPARVKYAQMYASLVERLANEALAAGDHQRALQFALELLEIDRAHEGASRLVLRCFDALGRRAQALGEYSALRAYLQKHLGVDPMPETTELINAIMRREGGL
ncbi:MAG TPA: BTAD domain-containing putative transcriptional regulator [Candidatus Elarobacter sp.]|jgi:DNA-binding SARP family transcriptional activator